MSSYFKMVNLFFREFFDFLKIFLVFWEFFISKLSTKNFQFVKIFFILNDFDFNLNNIYENT